MSENTYVILMLILAPLGFAGFCLLLAWKMDKMMIEAYKESGMVEIPEPLFSYKSLKNLF